MNSSAIRNRSGRSQGVNTFAAAALLAAATMFGSACGSDESNQINADDQDPACHSRALMIASSDPNFEWNESGMDAYHQAYDTCVQHAEVLVKQ